MCSPQASVISSTITQNSVLFKISRTSLHGSSSNIYSDIFSLESIQNKSPEKLAVPAVHSAPNDVFRNLCFTKITTRALVLEGYTSCDNNVCL